MLLQEKYKHNPWKLLVVCALLNQTHRREVEPVAEKVFAAYPGPVDMAASGRGLEELIRPLGLWSIRGPRLRKLSRDYVGMGGLIEELPWQDVAEIHGVGAYALDSYCFFVLGDFSKFRSKDKELKKWLLQKTEDDWDTAQQVLQAAKMPQGNADEHLYTAIQEGW